jgi:uncharacterized repeat protein (TIGR03803 family)
MKAHTRTLRLAFLPTSAFTLQPRYGYPRHMKSSKIRRSQLQQKLGTILWLLIVSAATIAMAATSGATAKETELFSFPGQPDGALPSAGLTLGADGAIYGTTLFGGTGGCLNGCGTVFRLKPANGGVTVTIIHNFQFALTDGQNPTSSVVFDAAGNLYGTAPGGLNGCGVVYKLTPTQNGEWTETVLHNFNAFDGHKDGCLDGGGSNLPTSSLIFDTRGNLYGTTNKGGGGDTNFFCTNGCGTVFQMTPNANGTWKERVVHSFPKSGHSADGATPEDGLIMDEAGALYGTTYFGGSSGRGIVFKLAPEQGGSWREAILFTFRDNSTGENPRGGVVMDKSGNLYGTTLGGSKCQQCAGVAFKLTPTTKGPWKEAIIHAFNSGIHHDGALPQSGLLMDGKGNLYGSTLYGGGRGCESLGCGTVYELSPGTKGSFTEQVLIRFSGGSDGGVPEDDRLAMDASGNLYGTAVFGGQDGAGVVFKIKP